MFTLCCGPLFSSLCFTDSRDCDYYAAKKQDFTLPLHYALKESEQLRWIHGNNVIFDRRQNLLLIGKADDVSLNGSLKLRNVNESKAGKYSPTVYDDGQEKSKLNPIFLCVMGKFQIVLTTVMYNNVATFCHQVTHDKDGRRLFLLSSHVPQMALRRFDYRLEEGHNTQTILSSFKERKSRTLICLRDLADCAERQH